MNQLKSTWHGTKINDRTYLGNPRNASIERPHAPRPHTHTHTHTHLRAHAHTKHLCAHTHRCTQSMRCKCPICISSARACYFSNTCPGILHKIEAKGHVGKCQQRHRYVQIQTNRPIDRYIDRQTDRQTDRWMHGQIIAWIDR